MSKFEIWTNPAVDNLKVFEERLEAESVTFDREWIEDGGQDRISYLFDDVVYTFDNESDYLFTEKIYMNT